MLPPTPLRLLSLLSSLLLFNQGFLCGDGKPPSIMQVGLSYPIALHFLQSEVKFNFPAVLVLLFVLFRLGRVSRVQLRDCRLGMPWVMPAKQEQLIISVNIFLIQVPLRKTWDYDRGFQVRNMAKHLQMNELSNLICSNIRYFTKGRSFGKL